MELRKDPVTQSWMLVGDEEEPVAKEPGPCPYCEGSPEPAQKLIFAMPREGSPPPSGNGVHRGPWSVRVYPHPAPLYRIEFEEGRAAEGIYDRMRPVGAHEVIVENPDHGWHLWTASDQEVERVLRAYAHRITDLKRDVRFKYVTVFRNRGAVAGEEFAHPHSQITATPFVPRRLVYELRAAHDYYQRKERCVFCDIVRQEESRGLRVVEATANYLAFCPFASRVPYEFWIAPRYHHAAYETDLLERSDAGEVAGLLRRSLARLTHLSDTFHLVLHTIPNTRAKLSVSEPSSILDEYHWHFEILPIAEKRTKSYSIKEVYFSAVSPEHAAELLRQAPSAVDAGQPSFAWETGKG